MVLTGHPFAHGLVKEERIHAGQADLRSGSAMRWSGGKRSSGTPLRSPPERILVCNGSAIYRLRQQNALSYKVHFAKKLDERQPPRQT